MEIAPGQNDVVVLAATVAVDMMAHPHEQYAYGPADRTRYLEFGSGRVIRQRIVRRCP